MTNKEREMLSPELLNACRVVVYSRSEKARDYANVSNPYEYDIASKATDPAYVQPFVDDMKSNSTWEFADNILIPHQINMWEYCMDKYSGQSRATDV